jgi:hypothetical protein
MNKIRHPKEGHFKALTMPTSTAHSAHHIYNGGPHKDHSNGFSNPRGSIKCFVLEEYFWVFQKGIRVETAN